VAEHIILMHLQKNVPPQKPAVCDGVGRRGPACFRNRHSPPHEKSTALTLQRQFDVNEPQMNTNAVSLFVTFVFICGFPYVVVFKVAL
jgi:hypothetical protein